MRTFLLGICISIASFALAQRECHTSEYTAFLKASDPGLLQRSASIEQFIQQRLTAQPQLRTGSDAVLNMIRIPVVVHVLYANAAQNIPDAQIRGQIEALNRDFRRRNPDTSNTPARFRPLGMDAAIEFVLATADPLGRPTNGIVRKQTNVARWRTDDRIKRSSQGGSDAWDSRSYLNIWVGNMEGVIGYASVPGCDPAVDGVVLSHTVCGTNLSGNYNMGRTGVHEVGHWLGLRHIWGDTYCGNDGVDDTPQQGSFTPGCPNTFRSSCTNGSLGDMYMNYMDYTFDACMNLFTIGQVSRMRALFDAGGARAALLQSKGLHAPWTEAAPLPVETVTTTAIRFYPNPVVSNLTLELPNYFLGKTLTLSDANGVVVSRIVVTAPRQAVAMAHLPRGVYFLQGDAGEQKLRQKFIKL